MLAFAPVGLGNGHAEDVRQQEIRLQLAALVHERCAAASVERAARMPPVADGADFLGIHEMNVGENEHLRARQFGGEGLLRDDTEQQMLGNETVRGQHRTVGVRARFGVGLRDGFAVFHYVKLSLGPPANFYPLDCQLAVLFHVELEI